MKKCSSDGLVERGPNTLLFVLSLGDPQTLLYMTFFCLMGICVKDHVHGPLLLTNLYDVRHRKATAINSVNREMLIHACVEFSCRNDVAYAAGDGDNEYL